MIQATTVAADAQAITVGERRSIESEVLQESREILVRLPSSYSASDFRYPVLYVLDAESEFLHTVAAVEFLSSTGQMPETIVIGISNTIRSRDLTPPSDDKEETGFWPAVGGAESFRRFLREELIPLIESDYRTEPYRSLRGNSFGGLFAINDYMSDDPIFNAVIVASPAVGWNYGELISRVPEFFEDGIPRPIFVGAAGKDYPGNLENIREFARAVETASPDSALWRFVIYDRDSHYSLAFQSTFDGLRFLFEGWQVPDDIAARADFAGVERHYASLSARFGYTVKIPLLSVIRLGNQLLREKRWSDGIAVMRRNLELYPSQPESYWHVGDAYLLSGDLEAARPWFVKAVQAAEALGSADLADYEHSLVELDSELISR
jgi:predicted alpha/beta superfamily hydrolase